MPAAPFNLALETSGRVGSVALGRGDALLATRSLGEPRRHNLGLMPTIDALCREHGAAPRDLGELYVSLGPGSFTGLRVGITTVKMLALATGARVVGVPTLDTLAAAVLPPLPLGERAGVRGERASATDRESAQAIDAGTGTSAPHPNPLPEGERGSATIAVGLNLKRGTLYSAVYRGGAELLPPALRTLEDLLAGTPRPAWLIAEKLPDDAALPDGVTRMPPDASLARADVLWRLGRRLAARGRFTAPAALVPLYVREPEAVTLWNERHA